MLSGALLGLWRGWSVLPEIFLKIITVLLLVTASADHSMQDDLCVGKCGAYCPEKL